MTAKASVLCFLDGYSRGSLLIMLRANDDVAINAASALLKSRCGICTTRNDDGIGYKAYDAKKGFTYTTIST